MSIAIPFNKKYRPKSLEDYLGNNVRNKLYNISKENSGIKTILMAGTRGSGKTSAARLLAKEIQCISKVDGHSCGECEYCKIIENYILTGEDASYAGVSELDIASDSGKAAIDGYLDEAVQLPMYPLKSKILIFDEVHMATTQAQNRMLKIVEEVPEHLYIIFCTTDPQKILNTLYSRFQSIIEVEPHTTEDLVGRLLHICTQENIVTSREALELIVKKADRIPRNAINSLESISANYGKQVLLETVFKELEKNYSESYNRFFKVANTSIEDIASFVYDLKQNNVSFNKFITGLTRYVLDCLYIKSGCGLDIADEKQLKHMKALFKTYSTDELDLLLQIVEYAMKNISTNEEQSELVVTTTAMRIGKIKILSAKMNRLEENNEKNNKLSVANYVKDKEEIAIKNNKQASVNINDGILSSVIGRELKDVNLDIEIDVDDSEDIEVDAEVNNIMNLVFKD